MTTHYLPRKDRELLAWTINFLRYLYPALARFNFPAAEYDKLTALRDDFSQKLDAATEPATRTKTSVLAKNIARAALEKALQQDVKEFLLFNRNVTDEDHDDLGLPIYKTSRTPTPVATTIPWVQVVMTVIRYLRFDFGGSETSRAKPAGQHGMELAGLIGGERPANVHALTLSYFDTHTPLSIAFEEEDRGKTFWFAVRWENTRGEKGPWSEIQSAIIP